MQGRAAHAGPEDPGCKTPPRWVEPCVHERDADGERGAGNAKEEAEHQEQCVRPQ
jgi:hypothetical protein